ncbi:MAG: hypothetical protein JW940_18090 [Polyangiaceae bacterium]|nr:hypothetical protein [Polyangiaceae bacterium]
MIRRGLQPGACPDSFVRSRRRAFMGPAVMTRQALHLIAAAARRKLLGHRQYDGTAREICEQVVHACFEPRARFFRASPGSYAEFWARDFGRCVPALLELGFEREVGDTYCYALSQYASAGHFALVITRAGHLFDFPAYASDGLAFFLHGLGKLGDGALVRRHRGFLEREVERFVDLVIDPGTGLVRRRTLFSEAQDYAIRDSSCYSNCLVYVLRQALDRLGLSNPLERYDYPTLVVQRFWDRDHFLDDQGGSSHPAGDAQVLPFWSGLFGRDTAARTRLGTVLRWMDAAGLNHPLPCRYGVSKSTGPRMHALHRINPWQRDTVWTCLGLHLLEVLRDFGHPRLPVELERYRTMVERVGCFPEILDGRTAELYDGPLVMSEDSMLWAASLWNLLAPRGVGTAGPGHHASEAQES